MKYKLLLLSIIGTIMLAAIIVSCSKQNQPEPNELTTEIIHSSVDIQIEHKINSFKNKFDRYLENPQFKSGETITVDSAVWYIEAASNQTYSNAGMSFVEFVVDSFNIDVPASNGEIQLNDLLFAYGVMVNGLSESYQAIPEENKHLVLNDVSLKLDDEGTATFGIFASFGVEAPGGTSGFFSSDWHYGELKGDCDFNYPGTDAAEKIEDRILARKGTPPPYTYYTEVETFNIYASDYVNTEDLIPWNNMYDYLMFYCWDDEDDIMPNVHTCVSVEEMNFYLLGTEYVLYHDQPEYARPVGKNLITVDLIGDAMYPAEGTIYDHHATVKYGIPHIGVKPPSKL